MACDKEQIGQDYVVRYYIAAGCGDTQPDDGLFTDLGGFTDKSASRSRNPIETADDSSPVRRNRGGTRTESFSGTVNIYGSSDGGTLSAAQKAFMQHYDSSENPCLWVQIENEFVTKTMYCLMSSIEDSLGEDANATGAVELPNAGPLGMLVEYA